MPFCVKCGSELAEGTAFCGKCGANQAAPQAAPQAAANVNAQQPLAEGTGTKVNQITYALLAFFVGGLGVHKFYVGKIGLGIVYLLFCWTAIPSIIAFIEAIIAITKKADANGDIYI